MTAGAGLNRGGHAAPVLRADPGVAALAQLSPRNLPRGGFAMKFASEDSEIEIRRRPARMRTLDTPGMPPPVPLIVYVVARCSGSTYTWAVINKLQKLHGVRTLTYDVDVLPLIFPGCEKTEKGCGHYHVGLLQAHDHGVGARLRAAHAAALALARGNRSVISLMAHLPKNLLQVSDDAHALNVTVIHVYRPR